MKEKGGRAMSGNEDGYGRRRFKLGVVELTAIIAGLGLCVWLLSQQYNAFTKRQADMTTQVSALVTQVAVMNEQLKTLTLQLADVPANTKAVAALQAEYADHERRLEALEHKGPK